MGPLTPAEKDEQLNNKMKMLESSMMDDGWLYRKAKRVEERIVKVRAGLEIRQRIHKATGGLIRADFVLDDGLIKGVFISGDFFCFPVDAVDWLAAKLEACPLDNIANVVTDFYKAEDTEIPGVTVADWLQVFRI